MIEVVTVNGWRRLVSIDAILSISELTGERASNLVIVLSNGETIFVSNRYDEVKSMIFNERVSSNA